MHILIVKTSSLGDIIHAFPVLRFLASNYPQVKIDWVVEEPFSSLVKAHPLVNQTICVQTKKWRGVFWQKNVWREIKQFLHTLRITRYDLVLDLQGNTKSAAITAAARSPLKVGFGKSTVAEWPNLLVTNKKINPPLTQNIREDYLFLAKNALPSPLTEEDKTNEKELRLLLSALEKKQLEKITHQIREAQGLHILVSLGSNWPNKQLKKKTLQEFLQCLSKEWTSYFFFIWGSPVEKELVKELSLSLPQNSTVLEKLSLPLLQNIMMEMDLVIAMDSLPLHLAGTTKTATYSIFGPSSARKYKPVGKKHEALQGTCPYGKQFEKRCAILRTCKTGACMKELSGKDIFAHCSAWMRQTLELS